MEYRSMCAEEIDILKNLKNLISISSHIIKSTGKVVISCSCENGKNFSYSNKDRYFDLFIKVLIKRYEEEKDKRNIIILDSYTKSLISNVSSPYPRLYKEYYKYCNSKIYYQKYDITSLRPLIIHMLAILFGVQGIDILDVSDFLGIRNTFSLYIDTPMQRRVVTIKFTKKDEFNYEVILGNIFGFSSVRANISFDDQGIHLNYNVNGLNIYGSSIFLIEKGKVKQVDEMYYANSEKYYNETEYMPSDNVLIGHTKIDDIGEDYEFFNLPLGIYIATKIDDNIRDINYFTNSKHLLKNRNVYTVYKNISGIDCPIISTKRISEQYKIDDGLMVMQISFDDVVYEDDLYRNELVNNNYFAVIKNGQIIPLTEKNDDYFVDTLDEKTINLFLGGKKYGQI